MIALTNDEGGGQRLFPNCSARDTRTWTFTDRRREAAGRAHVALAPSRSEGQTATVPGKVPARPVCVQPLQNARIGGIMPSWPLKLVVDSGSTGSAVANRSR